MRKRKYPDKQCLQCEKFIWKGDDLGSWSCLDWQLQGLVNPVPFGNCLKLANISKAEQLVKDNSL